MRKIQGLDLTESHEVRIQWYMTRPQEGWSPLHWAVHRKNEALVRLLLERGMDPDVRDAYGWTPLHLSVEENWLEGVDLLLRAGANVNAVTFKPLGRYPSRMTPTDLAERMEHQAVLTRLKRSGGRTSRELRRQTRWFQAVHQGKVQDILEFLNDGLDPDVQDREGNTALHLAVLQDHLELMRILLDHGAHPDTPNLRGRTPLHLAARRCNRRAVRLLLKHGAQPNLQDRDGCTPLSYAALEGCPRVLLELVHARGDTRIKTHHGWNLAHCAAYNGHLNVLRILPALGVCFNHLTEKPWKEIPPGSSVLDIARLRMHHEVARWIQRRGGQPGDEIRLFEEARRRIHDGDLRGLQTLAPPEKLRTLRGNLGLTLLHVAAIFDRPAVVAWMLSRGFDTTAKDFNGFTPLHYAAAHASLEVVEQLLNAGADPNVRAHYGWTPLHLAAREGRTEILCRLLDAGADPNARAENGETPLILAIKKDQTEAAACLLEAGAVPTDESPSSHSATPEPPPSTESPHP